MEESKNTMERKFTCPWPDCFKTFMRKTDVTRHERIHSNIRPFKCEWQGCQKAFMQRSAVKIHYRTHTGEKPNRCPFEGCGKAFNDTSSLARHRRTHHYDTPFPCSFRPCQERFATRKLLMEHEKDVHGAVPAKRLSVDLSRRETEAKGFSQQATPDSSTPKEIPTFRSTLIPQPSEPLDFGKVTAFANYPDNDTTDRFINSGNEDCFVNTCNDDRYVNTQNQNDDRFLSDRYVNNDRFQSDKRLEMDYSRSLPLGSPGSPHPPHPRFDQRSMSISHFPPSGLEDQMSFLQQQQPLSATDSYATFNMMMAKHPFRLGVDTLGAERNQNRQNSFNQENRRPAFMVDSRGPVSPFFLDSRAPNPNFSENMPLPTPKSSTNSSSSVSPYGQHFQIPPPVTEETQEEKTTHGDLYNLLRVPVGKQDQRHNTATQNLSISTRQEDLHNLRREKSSKPPRINTSVSYGGQQQFQFVDYSLKSATAIEDRTQNTPLLSPLYPPRTADALTHYFNRFSTDDSH